MITDLYLSLQLIGPWQTLKPWKKYACINTRLVNLLSSLPTQPARQLVELWRVQKGQRTRTTRVLHSLGNRITAAQAKRLDTVCHTQPRAISELLPPEMRSSRRFSGNEESVANHYERSSSRSFRRWETAEIWSHSLLSFLSTLFSFSFNWLF